MSLVEKQQPKIPAELTPEKSGGPGGRGAAQYGIGKCAWTGVSSESLWMRQMTNEKNRETLPTFRYVTSS